MINYLVDQPQDLRGGHRLVGPICNKQESSSFAFCIGLGVLVDNVGIPTFDQPLSYV